MTEPIVVTAIWDPETKVWVAESNGLPGLATGADTLEELVEKLKVAIPELLAENGIPVRGGQFAVQDRSPVGITGRARKGPLLRCRAHQRSLRL
jgi:predicted RNase H-like HicB family nuclease